MAEAATKEPTMDDILASIRKIISQEDSKTRPAEMQAPAPVAPSTLQPSLASLQAATRAATLNPGASASPVPTSPQMATRPMAQSPQSTASSTVPKTAPYQPATQVAPRAQAPSSLAALASQVKSQMPHPAAQASGSPTIQGQSGSRPPQFQPVLAQQAPMPYSAPAQTPLPVSAQPVVQPKPVVSAAVTVQPSSQKPDSEVSAFRDALVSPSTVKKVDQSIDRLKAAVADNTSAKVEAVLRPMLREWLDLNLPGMVERIVREEIEKIARS